MVNGVFLDRTFARKVLSDRSTSFRNSLCNAIYASLIEKKIYTSAYHPQTDGMAERFMHTLTAMLAHYVDTEGADDWDLYLPVVQYAYNTSVHATTGVTPHEALHGWAARAPAYLGLSLDPLTQYGSETWAESLGKRMERMREYVKQNDERAKEYSKQYFDQHHKNILFHEGEMVMVRNEKLLSKFDAKLLGPFRVTKANHDKGVYQLDRGDWVNVQRLYHYPGPAPEDAVQEDQRVDEE